MSSPQQVEDGAPSALDDSTTPLTAGEAGPDDGSARELPQAGARPWKPVVAGLAGLAAVGTAVAASWGLMARTGSDSMVRALEAPFTNTLDTSMYLAATTTAKSISAGATEIEVADEKDFAVGHLVQISGWNSTDEVAENGTIVGFGSIKFAEPLQHSYSAGANVFSFGTTTTTTTTATTTTTSKTTTSTATTSTTTSTYSRPHDCSREFRKPPRPSRADEHNGIALEDTCIDGDGPFHAFIIGDWGGIIESGNIKAAPHLSHRKQTGYNMVWPIDEVAQSKVRDQMKARAPVSKPDYFLNVGDNFYWAGVEDNCGAQDITVPYSNGGTWVYKNSGNANQFERLFEWFYTGDGIDGKPWLGVLGNHDYGGWLFSHAWDQNIGYTWATGDSVSGRWLTPAMYYQSKVWYPDFAVDYYFLDTNVYDALDPHDGSPHNICSEMHNNEAGITSCAPVGPDSVWGCQEYFWSLWGAQKNWLDEVVPKSKADWRIVVTHFPPCWGAPDWTELAPKHEFDLVISGHRHRQDIHMPGDERKLVWWGDPNQLYNDFLDPTVWVVSGGGGGVTSEKPPTNWGEDDMYGFMDLTLEKEKLTVEAISHGGQLRRSVEVWPSYPHHPSYDKAISEKRARDARRRACPDCPVSEEDQKGFDREAEEEVEERKQEEEEEKKKKQEEEEKRKQEEEEEKRKLEVPVGIQTNETALINETAVGDANGTTGFVPFAAAGISTDEAGGAAANDSPIAAE